MAAKTEADSARNGNDKGKGALESCEAIGHALPLLQNGYQATMVEQYRLLFARSWREVCVP